MELASHKAKSLCYYYYKLGSLSKPTNQWGQAVNGLDQHVTSGTFQEDYLTWKNLWNYAVVELGNHVTK